MKKHLFFITNALFALVIAGFISSCKNHEDPIDKPVEKPSISLKAGDTGIDFLEFTITPEKAEQVAWVYIKSDESIPVADEILANGTAADAEKESTAKAKGLQPETEYTIVAAARNGEETAVSEALKMTTKKADEPTPDPEIIEVTLSSAVSESDIAAAEEGIYTIRFSAEDKTEVLMTFQAEAGDRLPADDYGTGTNLNNVSISIKGEDVLTPESGFARVALDETTYTISMEFTIDELTIFKGEFTGAVEGYPLEKQPTVTDLDMMYIFESGYYTSASYPDVAQYTFDISDMEFKTNGDPAGNAKAFQLVVYGTQGPNEEYIGLPAGQYSLKQTAYMESGKFTAVYKEYDKDGFTDVEKYFTEGTLTITDEGSCLLELSVTDKDGNVINTVFEGEIAFKNPNYKPEEPEPSDWTCTDAINSGNEDFLFKFKDADGKVVEVDIILAEPADGGLPAGTYSVKDDDAGDHIDKIFTVIKPDPLIWYQKFYIASGSVTVDYDAEEDMVVFSSDLTFEDGSVMKFENMKFKSSIKILTGSTEPEPEPNFTCTGSYNEGDQDFMFYFTGKDGSKIEIDIYFDTPTAGGLPAGTYHVGSSGAYIVSQYTTAVPAGAQWHEKYYASESDDCYITVGYDAENDMVTFDVNLTFDNTDYVMRDPNLKFKSGIKII